VPTSLVSRDSQRTEEILRAARSRIPVDQLKAVRERERERERERVYYEQAFSD
jgi:hypothetical protein